MDRISNAVLILWTMARSNFSMLWSICHSKMPLPSPTECLRRLGILATQTVARYSTHDGRRALKTMAGVWVYGI